MCCGACLKLLLLLSLLPAAHRQLLLPQQRGYYIYVLLLVLLQGAIKGLNLKKRLGKKLKQNRPLPHWVRMKTDCKIRSVVLRCNCMYTPGALQLRVHSTASAAAFGAGRMPVCEMRLLLLQIQQQETPLETHKARHVETFCRIRCRSSPCRSSSNFCSSSSTSCAAAAGAARVCAAAVASNRRCTSAPLALSLNAWAESWSGPCTRV